MARGVYRRVFFLGNYAIKLPRLKNFLLGARCNRWEREMWRIWRPIFGWENLCPVKFSDPLGIVVVMPRALQPVTFEQIQLADYDYYPDITAETKTDDWGLVSGRTLALDYGLPDSDAIQERRAYYWGFANK